MAISGGVIYLDGGWQTLVNGLVAEAQDAKVRIVKGKRVVPVAFGIDSPLYLSVHSASAILAPKSGALIHLLKYVSPSIESNPIKDESDLEYLLDVVQPGWRTLVVRRRFLPNMIVSNALVTAEQGGTPGRPDTRVPNTDNLYIVGDWVGPEGLLADASFSSAKRAAQQILKTHPYDRILCLSETGKAAGV